MVTKLFGQKSGKTTPGIFTTNTDGDVYSKGMKISNSTYTSKGTMSGKCTADEMLKDIGKELKKDGLVSWVDGDTFHLDNTGKSCSLKQLKSALGYNNPKSMEVSGNTITFEDNTYYKFTDSSGKEHKVLSIGGQLSDFLSEYDKEEADYINFWNCVARKDPTFVGLEYSPTEVRNRLSEAGIQTGFFNINIGDEQRTQFLSQGKYSAAVYSKAQYDDYYYNHIQSGNLTRDYEAGTVIKIAGEEYTVDENGKIDVPYGVDIWDIEYPENYRFGKKIY